MNEKFKIYLNLLEEFNRHTNLVSSADEHTVATKHFEDSLAINRLSGTIDLDSPLAVVDIGCGAGFPGMPVIIEHPKLKLCAVDSIGKKLEFIKILAKQLEMSNRVEVVCARAEELARKPDKREQFDLALIRAVAKLNIIAEYCLPFVKLDGHFVAYKAKNVEQEIEEAQKAISELGGKVVSVAPYTLSSGEERNLVVIKKIRPTPEKYPRKPGVPAKRPL